MRRRGFLALIGAASSTIAGCDGVPGEGGETAAPRTTSQVTSSTPTPVRESIGSVDLPVPRNEIRTPLPRDHIPAIVDPAFDDDWTDLEVPDSSMYDGGPLLPDDSAVIGVEYGDEARAYPLRILDWHEVVNDGFESGSKVRTPSDGDFAGPLLVSYCPLCGSGVTARRTVDGVETRFGVSGRLWRNNLLMYDGRTESLWSQLLGAAIRGSRTGERLSLLPSSLTTWGKWRDANPETVVLLPPPHSNTVRGADATFDYFSPKYSYENEDQLIGFDDESDGRLHPKTLVIGVTADGAVKAYTFGVVRERDVINDTVGDLPVVVATAPEGTLVAYDRRLDSTTVEFEPAGNVHVRAGGSRWDRTTSRAVDGPHRGSRLEPATDLSPMFWSAWSDFHPDTDVYGRRIGE